MGEVLQALVINTDGKAVIVGFFEAKSCNDGHKIGIAAAFANAVQGSLHVAAACINRCQ